MHTPPPRFLPTSLATPAHPLAPCPHQSGAIPDTTTGHSSLGQTPFPTAIARFVEIPTVPAVLHLQALHTRRGHSHPFRTATGTLLNALAFTAGRWREDSYNHTSVGAYARCNTRAHASQPTGPHRNAGSHLPSSKLSTLRVETWTDATATHRLPSHHLTRSAERKPAQTPVPSKPRILVSSCRSHLSIIKACFT